ncbi:MAG: trypsin-like peptidase domain-containing protein [Pseudomonadota bacterium]
MKPCTLAMALVVAPTVLAGAAAGPAVAQSASGTSDEHTLRQGEEIIAYGFPLRGLLASGASLTTGTVSALAGICDDPNRLQMTAPVEPGNSGGPLLERGGTEVGAIVSKPGATVVAGRPTDIPQNVNFALLGRGRQGLPRSQPGRLRDGVPGAAQEGRRHRRPGATLPRRRGLEIGLSRTGGPRTPGARLR